MDTKNFKRLVELSEQSDFFRKERNYIRVYGGTTFDIPQIEKIQAGIRSEICQIIKEL